MSPLRRRGGERAAADKLRGREAAGIVRLGRRDALQACLAIHLGGGRERRAGIGPAQIRDCHCRRDRRAACTNVWVSAAAVLTSWWPTLSVATL